MFKKIRDIVRKTDYDIIQMTTEIKDFSKKMLIISFLGIVFPDLLAFSLRGANMALAAGNIGIMIVLLLTYYSSEILSALFETYQTFQTDNYNQLKTNESTKIVLQICNICKNRVFKLVGKLNKRVEHAELIKVVKDYTGDFWSLALLVPTTIISVLILIVTISINFVMDITTKSLQEAIISTAILVLLIIASFIVTRMRIKIMRKYRKTRKENEKLIEVAMTEIKVTDFISKKDFDFHANKVIKLLNLRIDTEKTERLKLNSVFILRSLISTGIMISLVAVNFIHERNFSPYVLCDIIATSSVYATIIHRIGRIADKVERLSDTLVDMDALAADFENIYNVFKKEIEKAVITIPMESVTVTEFSFSQDNSGSFELINPTQLSMSCGQVYLVHGHTGCGKSTLISLLTGKIGFQDSPIQFSNGNIGYLNSIAYETDSSICNNYVLEEIGLTEDYATIDYDRATEILSGLNLWDEILTMAKMSETEETKDLSEFEKVFNYLQTRKFSEFSAGQKQRLALTKLLYNMDNSMQLVALDEPFNRLDDATAIQCMKFVTEYVQRDMKRILIVATHQVAQCREYANYDISFRDNLGKSFMLMHRA